MNTCDGGAYPLKNKELQINEQIRDRELRVIDSDGSQLGVMSLRQAMDLAEQKNLDLVKIAPQATPPVCKIIDYGKFRFEQAKREKEAKKNQRSLRSRRFASSTSIRTTLKQRRIMPCVFSRKGIR